MGLGGMEGLRLIVNMLIRTKLYLITGCSHCFEEELDPPYHICNKCYDANHNKTAPEEEDSDQDDRDCRHRKNSRQDDDCTAAEPPKKKLKSSMVKQQETSDTKKIYNQHRLAHNQIRRAVAQFGNRRTEELKCLGETNRKEIFNLKNPLVYNYENVLDEKKIPKDIKMKLISYLKQFCIYCLRKIRQKIQSKKLHYQTCSSLSIMKMNDEIKICCNLCPEIFSVCKNKNFITHLNKIHTLKINNSTAFKDYSSMKQILSKDYTCIYHPIQCNFIGDCGLQIINHFFTFLVKKQLDTNKILKCVLCSNTSTLQKDFTLLEYLNHLTMHLQEKKNYLCKLPNCINSEIEFSLKSLLHHLNNQHKLSNFKIERCLYFDNLTVIQLLIKMKLQCLLRKSAGKMPHILTI